MESVNVVFTVDRSELRNTLAALLDQSSHFCDIAIKTQPGGPRVLANRLLLATYSKHFRQAIKAYPWETRPILSLEDEGVGRFELEEALRLMLHGKVSVPSTEVERFQRTLQVLGIEAQTAAAEEEAREDAVDDSGFHSSFNDSENDNDGTGDNVSRSTGMTSVSEEPGSDAKEYGVDATMPEPCQDQDQHEKSQDLMDIATLPIAEDESVNARQCNEDGSDDEGPQGVCQKTMSPIADNAIENAEGGWHSEESDNERSFADESEDLMEMATLPLAAACPNAADFAERMTHCSVETRPASTAENADVSEDSITEAETMILPFQADCQNETVEINGEPLHRSHSEADTDILMSDGENNDDREDESSEALDTRRVERDMDIEHDHQATPLKETASSRSPKFHLDVVEDEIDDDHCDGPGVSGHDEAGKAESENKDAPARLFKEISNTLPTVNLCDIDEDKLEGKVGAASDTVSQSEKRVIKPVRRSRGHRRRSSSRISVQRYRLRPRPRRMVDIINGKVWFCSICQYWTYHRYDMRCHLARSGHLL